MERKPDLQRIFTTSRIEAFSDGVFAIIVTLLIFEVHVPELKDFTNTGAWTALLGIAPKFSGFAVGFFTITIFWVNHHHFFHRIEHADWKLMWYNNLLLFFLTVIPFCTAFVGDHPTQPLIVAIYGLNMFLASAAFALMRYYVFFTAGLVARSVPMAERRREWHRSWVSTATYAVAALTAFAHPYIALGLFGLVPLFFMVPNLLKQESDLN